MKTLKQLNKVLQQSPESPLKPTVLAFNENSHLRSPRLLPNEIEYTPLNNTRLGSNTLIPSPREFISSAKASHVTNKFDSLPYGIASNQMSDQRKKEEDIILKQYLPAMKTYEPIKEELKSDQSSRIARNGPPSSKSSH